MKKFLVITFLLVILLSIGIYTLLLIISPATTDPITNAEGLPLENSIASLEEVKLGGLEQWLLIRGKDINKPVLLIVHGGPGSPEMPFFRHYNEGLEDDFIVVNWDQRGSGKSFSSQIPEGQLSMDHFISDTHELTQYLKEKFNKEKIYLLGHSWGSAIGFYAIKNHPEDYYAYIGVGQVVSMSEGERISYEYTLQKAREKNNKQAIEELEKIGYPPYVGDGFFDKLMKQRNWLTVFGGSLYGKTSYDEIVKIILFCEEYSFSDKINYLLGAKRSLEILWEPLMKVNLNSINEVEIPVYFVAGRSDYQVPSVLLEKYFETLKAPQKDLIWFEKSAHSAMFEESEKFHKTMVHKVFKETSKEVISNATANYKKY